MKARTKWVASAVAAGLVAGAASISIIASAQPGHQLGPSGASQNSPLTPSPLPPLVPPTTAPGATADDIANASEDLIENVLTATNTVNRGDIDSVLDSLKSVASSTILSGIEAERMELEDQGWTRSGKVTVDGVESLGFDGTADPPKATVRACLDLSDVVIRNADGDVLPAGAPRAWHIYDLEQVDGAWMLVRQTFADDPAC